MIRCDCQAAISSLIAVALQLDCRRSAGGKQKRLLRLRSNGSMDDVVASATMLNRPKRRIMPCRIDTGPPPNRHGMLSVTIFHRESAPCADKKRRPGSGASLLAGQVAGLRAGEVVVDFVSFGWPHAHMNQQEHTSQEPQPHHPSRHTLFTVLAPHTHARTHTAGCSESFFGAALPSDLDARRPRARRGRSQRNQEPECRAAPLALGQLDQR